MIFFMETTHWREKKNKIFLHETSMVKNTIFSINVHTAILCYSSLQIFHTIAPLFLISTPSLLVSIDKTFNKTAC